MDSAILRKGQVAPLDQSLNSFIKPFLR